MADRSFEIPFGPDRTGSMEKIPEVAPSVSPESVPEIVSEQLASDATRPVLSADQIPGFQPVTQEMPAAAPKADAPAQNADPGSTIVFEHVPVEVSELNVEADALLPDSALEAAPASEYGGQAEADGAVPGADAPIITPSFGTSQDEGDESDVDSEASQAIEGVQKSFAALRDSIGQGRELKAREKEREQLEEKMNLDREELADRDDILANYHALVAEQDAIIDENTRQRDAFKAEMAQVVAKNEETSEALARMRDYHDVQLDPLETALGRARASADQAKNDERSRKSELNSAESEARRASEGGDSTMAKAKLEQVKAAYDEAVARSNAAKEVLEDAQRSYDDLRAQVEQAEAPLERSIEELEKRADQLRDDIAKLGDVISSASKRRQYCDSVYQYPEETESLRRSIQSDEEAAEQMDREADELRELLAQSKAKSTKAKVAIAGVVVLIILVILIVWFLSSR